MRMREVLFAILTATVFTGLSAAEKPKLERGESFIETPAIAEGLCVSNVFQSNMVVQRDKPLAVWGWARRGRDSQFRR